MSLTSLPKSTVPSTAAALAPVHCILQSNALIDAPSIYGITSTAHWDEFVESLEDADVQWLGKNARELAQFCEAPAEICNQLPDHKVTLAEAVAICRTDASPVVCFFYTVAFGGIHRRNCKKAYADRHKWIDIIEDMRAGRFNGRAMLFDRFVKARVSGLGPAYFTKLMHTCCPISTCYILGQWTARSINLLLGPANKLIHLRSGTWVNWDNTGAAYDKYCCYLELIAKTLGCTAFEIEQAMFSGGRGHPWRKYLKSR